MVLNLQVLKRIMKNNLTSHDVLVLLVVLKAMDETQRVVFVM